MLCNKTLKLEELELLEDKISQTLSNMETILLPSFFTVMVHLVIHLAMEAKITGPVQCRWMYPIERYAEIHCIFIIHFKLLLIRLMASFYAIGTWVLSNHMSAIFHALKVQSQKHILQMSVCSFARDIWKVETQGLIGIAKAKKILNVRLIGRVVFSYYWAIIWLSRSI